MPQLRRLLARFPLLRFDPVSDFEAAARIDRSCRRAGVTPRGTVDCMIAAVAWRHGATVLTRDADLVRVARVTDIALDDAGSVANGHEHLLCGWCRWPRALGGRQPAEDS